MAGAPRPKKPIVPRPAKDLTNNPKDLRNKALREANRAANENKPRYKEKIGPQRPQGPERPLYKERIGPKKPSTSSTVGSTVARGLLKKVPVIGAAIGFIADAAPAGVGSDKPSGPLMKGNKKYATKIGPQRPTARKPAPSSNYTGQGKTSVSPMTGAGRPEYPSSNRSSRVGSGNTSGVGGPGGARAMDNTKSRKSGTSKAATAGAKKTSRRPQTKYQREALYMETRKR